jgi:hypothetical protein
MRNGNRRWTAALAAALVLGAVAPVRALGAPDKRADAALVEAVTRRDAAAVSAALGRGAAAGARDEVGTTALVLAARTGRGEIVQALLDAGADPKVHSWYGSIPIVEAAARGHGEVVRLLARSPKEVNIADKEGFTALHRAAERGNTDLAEFLLKVGAELEARAMTGATPLHLAAAAGHTEMCQRLMDRLPKKPKLLDRRSRTPLFYAVEHGRLETAEMLLERGADPKARSVDGRCAFIEAVSGIANHPRDLTEERAPLLERLLRSRFSVDSRDAAGATALHLAAELGKTSLVKRLLAFGANPAVKDHAGYTAYDYAVRRDRDEAAAVLKPLTPMALRKQ